MVLFMCRNKSSLNDLKLHGTEGGPGGPPPVHEGGGRAPPLGRAPCLVGPLMLHRPQLQLYIFLFTEKKIKEKSLSRFTIRSRRHALISLGRADL